MSMVTRVMQGTTGLTGWQYGAEKSAERRRHHIAELRRRGNRDVDEQVQLDRQAWLDKQTIQQKEGALEQFTRV